MDYLLINKMYESICDLTKYPLSIIDENGKVLVSKFKDLTGTFNEIAYALAESGQEYKIVNMADPESGVREGVYVTIRTGSHGFCTLCIYGPPKKVLPLARVMKHSLEVMSEFEFYKRNTMNKLSSRERFLKTIFSADYNPSDMEQAFRDTALDRELPRISLLLHLEASLKHISQITKQLEGSDMASKQDLIGITDDGNLFLLKVIQSDAGNIMEDYKYILGEYLSPALQYARTNNLPYSLYIGPIQNDILYYHHAYLYCRWMLGSLGRSGSYYFYDHITEYLAFVAPQRELDAIFACLKQGLDRKFIENYVETMSALIKKDYNLTLASESLHVHKNTLIYRLDKIRNVLSINPLTSNSGREFMECFYFYLTRHASPQRPDLLA